jgi:hypothetical protein
MVPGVQHGKLCGQPVIGSPAGVSWLTRPALQQAACVGAHLGTSSQPQGCVPSRPGKQCAEGCWSLLLLLLRLLCFTSSTT